MTQLCSSNNILHQSRGKGTIGDIVRLHVLQTMALGDFERGDVAGDHDCMRHSHDDGRDGNRDHVQLRDNHLHRRQHQHAPACAAAIAGENERL